VAQTFFMDDEIAESYLLDSILTLVDAKHAASSSTTARRRAARWALPTRSSSARPTWWPRTSGRADAPPEAHEPARAAAAVHFGEVPIKDVFDLRGFNLNAKLDIDPDFLKDDDHGHGHDHHDHDHAHGEHCDHPSHGEHEGHGHHHHHDDDVKSFVFKSERPFDPAKLEDFLGAIVNIYGPRMLRYKGVLNA
jgi:G3E family GTPase